MAKTATKKKPKGKKPRLRQAHLDGMEPPSIKAIDAAAEAYVDVRDERMSLGKQEKERKAILHALMKQHNLSVYEFGDNKVELDVKEKVRVRKAKEGESDAHDHEDDDSPDEE